MVFGNMGDNSATGVAFSRNPATGENKFYGEWLINAQGEDVVAGIRTPNPLNEATKNEHNRNLASLETAMPEVYKELDDIQNHLEDHFKDMQDIEFTIQDGKLWMLQCRSAVSAREPDWLPSIWRWTCSTRALSTRRQPS